MGSTPQGGWERRHEPVRLDLDAVSEMIAPVFAPRRAVVAQLLGGGLANTNYKLRLSGVREPFVLRLYTRDPAACEKEAALYARVRERVPVPHVFFADTEGRRFGHPYAITTWIEGEPLAVVLGRGAAAGAESVGHAAGATLAAIHAFTFPKAGFFGPGLTIAEDWPAGDASFLGYLEPRLLTGLAGQRLGDDLARRLWDFAREHVPLLQATGDDRALVHGDYKAQNLLMARDGEGGAWAVSGVLDWEFAFVGTPLFDVAILLRHDHELDPAFARGFARAYVEAGGALPPEWRRLARLLDLINLCGFLDLPGEREHLTRDATRLIVETMERWPD